MKPSEGGFELVYSPEWEARVYYTAVWNDWDLWRGISALGLPTLIIRGSDSDTFPASTAEAVHTRNPRIQIITVSDASHLAPLERPAQIALLCSKFLRGSDQR